MSFVQDASQYVKQKRKAGISKQAEGLITVCSIVQTSEYRITPETVSQLKCRNIGDFTLNQITQLLLNEITPVAFTQLLIQAFTNVRKKINEQKNNNQRQTKKRPLNDSTQNKKNKKQKIVKLKTIRKIVPPAKSKNSNFMSQVTMCVNLCVCAIFFVINVRNCEMKNDF